MSTSSRGRTNPPTVVRWSETPRRWPIAEREQSLAGTALLLWVGVAGPLLRALALPASEPWQVAAVGTLGSAALVASRRSPWLVRIVVAASCAAVLLPAQGQIIAAWIGAGLLIGAWVGLGARPLPFLPVPSRGTFAPVAVLAGVAAWQGTDPQATWQPLLLLALAGVVPLLGKPVADALHHAMRRLGRGVGRLLSIVAFGAIGIVAVLAPWLVHQPLGIDPLAPGRGWANRERRPIQVRSPWVESASDTSRGGRPRWALGSVIALVVALLGGAFAVGGGEVAVGGGEVADREPPVQRTGSDAVSNVGGSAWHRELEEDMAWVLDERVAFRPFEIYRLWDVETRHVNVRNGRRTTWRAPACGCDRLTVWLYGGSAVFGFGQRDAHTIASELSRIAWQDGIVVDVHNLGIPGQLHWRNAFRFSWDLAHRAPPDMAVFYDGADEVDSALELTDRNLGDTRAPFEPLGEQLFEALYDLPPVPAVWASVDQLGWPTVSETPGDDPGGLAATRFERTRKISADAGAAAAVPVRWFWQPTRYSLRSESPDDVTPDADDRFRARAFRRASTLLRPDVVDLSSAFDGFDGPLFADEFHHDERGARIVAAAIYDELGVYLQDRFRELNDE